VLWRGLLEFKFESAEATVFVSVGILIAQFVRDGLCVGPHRRRLPGQQATYGPNSQLIVDTNEERAEREQEVGIASGGNRSRYAACRSCRRGGELSSTVTARFRYAWPIGTWRMQWFEGGFTERSVWNFSIDGFWP
jgi:hypothetical protein